AKCRYWLILLWRRRVHLLQRAAEAAEGRAEFQKRAERNRVSVTTLVRQRIQARRSEDLAPTQPRGLRGIVERIVQSVGEGDRHAAHGEIRQMEKPQLIGLRDGRRL